MTDLGGFVYSTNSDEDFSSLEQEQVPTPAPEEQILECHFSNKGRGGKTVTVISGFVGSEQELKELAKLLKTRCSVGGSCKNGEILIQGNYRDKIMGILKDLGYKVKRIGG